MRRQHRRPHHFSILEGLRNGDLQHMVLDRFSIDHYKSKMGADEDIIVVAFKFKDKFPAIDAMEFIEKNYSFVLDADISAGEESDGKYSLFIEIERSPKFPSQLANMLEGLEKLCKFSKWRFRYFKDADVHDFSKEAIEQFVPLDPESYKERVKEHKLNDLSEILNQGSTEIVDIDENNNFTIRKPYAGKLELILEDLGSFQQLASKLTGAVQLDQAANSQVLFLEKYLGNYEIHKINNKFIIRNGDKAIIVQRKE